MQIARQPHFEMHALLRGRMREREPGGVQRKPRCAARILAARSEAIAAVYLIAADRMTRLGKMNANLVRAPRFQLALDEREIADPFENTYVRDRSLAHARLFRAASPAVSPVAHQVRRDRLRLDVTVDNGQISPLG